MISHHEYTQKLYPHDSEKAHFDTSVLDLNERLNTLPSEYQDLEIGLVAESDLYFKLYSVDDGTEKIEDLDAIDNIGTTLIRIFSDNSAGKKLNKAERSLLLEIEKNTKFTDELKNNDHKPITLGKVKDFINEYYSSIDIKSGLEVCDLAKDRLVDFLKTDSAASIITDANIRSKMVETVLATPLVVIDGLSLIEKKYERLEVGGFFSSIQRKAYVVINTDMNFEGLGKNSTGWVSKVVYHELLHACFAKNYRIKPLPDEFKDDSIEDDDHIIKLKNLFPLFVEEAVVEKIAFSIVAEDLSGKIDGLTDLGFLDEQPKGEFYSREDIPHRLGKYLIKGSVPGVDKNLPKVFSESESSTLHNNARRLVSNSYADFRLVFDYLFAEVDWKRAGIDRKEAEGLLANAVFEVPITTAEKTKKWPHRKMFFSKLREANGAGVFNRFNSALTNFPINDIIKSFNEGTFNQEPIDITDPAVLPNSTAYTKFMTLDDKLAASTDRLDRLTENGAPKFMLQKERDRIANLKKEIKVQKQKAMSAIGFKAHIDTDKRNAYNFKRRKTIRSLSSLERRGLEEYREKRRSARQAHYRDIKY